MLNEHSLMLGKITEGRSEEFTLKPSKAKAKKGPSFFDNLFAGFEKLAKSVKPAVKFARESGAPMPLDRDIEALQEKKADIRGLAFQMDDVIAKAVPRLVARKDPKAGQAADSLEKGARQAKAQISAAVRACDKAMSSAKTAQAQILRGVPTAKATGVFFLHKNQADAQVGSARLRALNVRSAWQNIERQLVSQESLVKGIANASKSTLQESADKFGNFLMQAGKAAETTAKGFGVATPYLKYAPYALVGLGGLYVWSILPKGQRS